MATTYHDFESPAYTAAQRLERLRYHIAEIEAMVSGPNVSADAKSIDRASLNQKLDRLYTRLRELENSPSAMRGGGVSLIRLGKAR